MNSCPLTEYMRAFRDIMILQQLHAGGSNSIALDVQLIEFSMGFPVGFLSWNHLLQVA